MDRVNPDQTVENELSVFFEIQTLKLFQVDMGDDEAANRKEHIHSQISPWNAGNEQMKGGKLKLKVIEEDGKSAKSAKRIDGIQITGIRYFFWHVFWHYRSDGIRVE